MKQVNETRLTEIKYWNAGAPSYRWNQIGNSLVSWENVDAVLRTPSAWMNIAIYDATVLAWKEKLKNKRSRPSQIDAAISPLVNVPATYSYPCEHTVTASAAAHVLAYFYPTKGDSVLQLARSASQSRIEAGLQFPSDADAGWKLGEQVAKAIIAKAKSDGSDKKWDGSKNTDPAKWTGPYPLGIMAAQLNPITMTSKDQFRPLPPPDFAAEMKELKDFKRTTKTNAIAYNWAISSYGYWIDIAARKMFEHRISEDAPAAARIFTSLQVGSHDAVIATMDAKYAFWGIRPSQYDTTYKPLLMTPPFPGYPSGHALGAGVSSAILEFYFPEDAKLFRQLAQECSDSRFYAGIHFKTDNEVGLKMGRDLGTFIAQQWTNLALTAKTERR